MAVNREIVVYQKQDDKFVESFEIDLSIDLLIEILNVDIQEDPDVYMVYQIDKNQYLKFQKLIPNLKELDFSNIDLF
ncbi:MAG: hypothetical protein EOO87_17625, partial [Pedobacter sp.]